MPADNIWRGVTGNFNDAQNWTDGVPTSDDVLIFTSTASPGYGSGQQQPPPNSPPPPPAPTGDPNRSVTFPSTADLSYVGIEIINGYSGTVTFPANITFWRYTQTTGATAQALATTLTVTGNLQWTGGVVNNTTSLATYRVYNPGGSVVTGSIGTDTTSLSSGSNILLQAAASVYGPVGVSVRQAGAVSVLNGGVVTVGEKCVFQMADAQAVQADGASPKSEAVVPVKPKNDHIVVDKGKVEMFGGKDVEIKSLLVKPGGEAIIKCDLKVTDKVPNQLNGVAVTEGKLTIACTTTTTVPHGVFLDKSVFTTVAGTGVSPETATIDGTLLVTQTTLRLTTPTETRFATLLVTQDATLNDGTFEATVSAQTGTKRDVIMTDKKFITSAQFKIKAIEKDKLNGEGATSGRTWKVMIAKLGFGSNAVPASLPAVIQGGVRVMMDNDTALAVQK